MAIRSGSMAREHGVLKLVHPKGRVELHKSPITAAEVMKRNPRHCVARPDVFKYPWIVVRPESVLKPGKVYFIVPHHTLRRLLEANGLGLDNSSIRQHREPHGHGPKGGYEQPRLSASEVDSIYDQFHDKKGSSADDELARFRHLVRKRSPLASQSDKNLKKPSPPNPKLNLITRSLQETSIVQEKPNPNHVSPIAGGTVHETHTSMTTMSPKRCRYASQRDKILKKPSPLNPKLNLITTSLQEPSTVQEKPNPHHVSIADSPIHETHTFAGPEKEGAFCRETVSKLKPMADQHVGKLKSCLKKHKNDDDQERRRGPRVRFEMPVEDQKGLRFRVFHFQRVDTP